MTRISAGYQGAKVLTFAGRRSVEMGRLIEKNGGQPVLAPVLREVPLENPPEFDQLLETLQSAQPVLLILLTGGGAKVLLQQLEKAWGRDALLKVLLTIKVLARGPKPAHVLRQWGWNDFITVPEPNTWHEIIAVLDSAGLPLPNSTAIVQEFGIPHPALANALKERRAKVLSIPVYRWAMPDNLAPVQEAIKATIAGNIAVTLWTAAAQAHHVFAIAETMHCADALREAFSKTLIGSIGPTTSAALKEHGLTPTLEPEHPKMGHLIKACAQKEWE